MHLAQEPLALGHLLVDAVNDETDVTVVALALGPLGEGADILDRARVQTEQIPQPAQLVGPRVVQVEPEELLSLQVPGDLIEPLRIKDWERRLTDAHDRAD